MKTLESYFPLNECSTATINIQQCEQCKIFRRVKSDAGEPMKILEESSEKLIKPFKEVCGNFIEEVKCPQCGDKHWCNEP